MTDAELLKAIKAKLVRRARKRAKLESLFDAFRNEINHRIERVVSEAVKAGELHVSNKEFFVPDVAPVWGTPKPAKKARKKKPPVDGAEPAKKKRKSKMAADDPRQVHLFI